MRFMRAFAFGAVAMAVLLGGVAAALSVLVAADGSDGVEFVLGPVVVFAVATTDGATSTSLGPGIALLSVVGGLVNAAALSLVERRQRSRDPIA